VSHRPLSSQQEFEAARLAEIVRAKTMDEVAAMCRLLASKPEAELFGKTEFELRDAAHRIAALLLQAAVDEREKKAGRPSPVRPANGRRNSSGEGTGV